MCQEFGRKDADTIRSLKKQNQELGGEDVEMEEIPQQRCTVKGDRFRPAKHRKKTEVRSVSRPDEAEGQRQNLTYSDLSKLSLGRMKQRICTEYSILEINSVVKINSRTFCSSKVSTLLNRADYLTKQHLTVILLRRCKGISSGCMPTSYFGWRQS